MKHLLLLACTAVVLSACGKTDSPPASKATADVAANIPAECSSYVNAVNTCVGKLGNNPGADAYKQQLEMVKAQWATVTDKAELAASCKTLEESFKATASSIGC